MPVALQGLRAGENLWVDAKGNWRGGYIPAIYRGYPFTLARSGDKRVLCIDSDSGLISNTEGQPFFNDDGETTDTIQQILQFLNQVHTSRDVTQAQCAELSRLGLIQPWPLTVQAEGENQAREGLYRIDEEALNALSTEDFEALRTTGALPMVYCQLLSMQHIQRLGELARMNIPAQASKKTSNGELDLEFLNQGGTISFN